MKVRTSSGRSREEGNNAATPTPAQDPGLVDTKGEGALGQGAGAWLGSVTTSYPLLPNMIGNPCSAYTQTFTLLLPFPAANPLQPPPQALDTLPTSHSPIWGAHTACFYLHKGHPHPAYLGEGTLSSDTGVQAPSRLLCSLNFPSNPRSISSR